MRGELRRVGVSFLFSAVPKLARIAGRHAVNDYPWECARGGFARIRAC